MSIPSTLPKYDGVFTSAQDIARGAQLAIERAFRQSSEWDRLKHGALLDMLERVYQVRILSDDSTALVQDRAPKTVGINLYKARDYEDALRWVMENRKPITNDSD